MVLNAAEHMLRGRQKPVGQRRGQPGNQFNGVPVSCVFRRPVRSRTGEGNQYPQITWISTADPERIEVRPDAGLKEHY